MHNNIYTGQTDGSVYVNHSKLDLRLDLCNHSPTGFAWGYGGSGPSQLALAILTHEFGEEWAQDRGRYQNFKFDVIAALPVDEPFTLTSADIQAWRDSLEKRNVS